LRRLFRPIFVLLCSFSVTSQAVFVPQEVVSIPAGIGVLGLTAWTLIRAASEAGYSEGPDYNIPLSIHEGILIQKLDDLRPAFYFPRGIKTISRRAAQQILSDVRGQGTPDNAFGSEVLAYLNAQDEGRRNSGIFPYLEGGTSSAYYHAKSQSRAIPGVDGDVNPLLAQNEGRFIDDGNFGYLGFHSRGELVPGLSYEFNPEWLGSARVTALQPDRRFFLHRGYAKYTVGKLEIEAGRDNIEWGYGRYSSMLFSGNSEPFYFVGLGNHQPVPLSGFLSFLGPTRSQFIVTAMEENQARGGSIVVGNRFSFLPLSTLEFGISYLTQFGGKGIGSNPLGFFGDSLVPNGAANRAVVTDVRVRIPQLKVDPFLEVYWEDCCTNVPFNPRDTMMTLGLHFPNVAGGGKLDYTLEWARTNEIAYRHSTFYSGYFHRRQGFGHPLGPDGDGVYHTFRYFYSPSLLFKILFAQEGRGVTAGTSKAEQRYRGQLNVQWEPSRILSIVATAGFEHIQSVNFVDRTTQNNYLGSLLLRTNY